MDIGCCFIAFIAVEIKMDKEVIWNIINSLLAGALVLLGSFSDGELSWKGFILAFVAGGAVAVSQFKDYWNSERPDYCPKLFSFIKL